MIATGVLAGQYHAPEERMGATARIKLAGEPAPANLLSRSDRPVFAGTLHPAIQALANVGILAVVTLVTGIRTVRHEVPGPL
jgi:hypothetical protein